MSKFTVTVTAEDIANTKKLLIDARALLAKGWMQGDWHNGDVVRLPTRWCSIGAIEWAGGGTAESSAKRALWRAVGTACISDWNDAPGRTQAEVLEAFDRAIALCEAPR